MDCCGSDGFLMKDSELQEKEADDHEEEEKPNTKTKEKRRLLCKNGKRVSSEKKKKKLRVKDFYMKIPKERPEIWDPEGGGVVARYDRVTDSSNPKRDELKSKLRSYADRAIQQYNKVESMDYRLVDVESATGYLCQGVLYCMTFTAKLPSQDDCDAIAFAAEVYEGLFEIFKELSLVCKNEDRPVYY